MPNAWINDRKKEYYYKKAKKENFRSRASYKLLQAVEKYNFIKPGWVVVDLGAAPGGWTQAARRIVDDRGFILAVDIKPLKSFSDSNTRTIIGNITDPNIINEINDF
ncbi:MAG: SAM-dependent methyltransferase [Candidatus Bathyarchaeota archaeon]